MGGAMRRPISFHKMELVSQLQCRSTGLARKECGRRGGLYLRFRSTPPHGERPCVPRDKQDASAHCLA
jgi:hypothetical protein